jgi:hypothetical protein
MTWIFPGFGNKIVIFRLGAQEIVNPPQERQQYFFGRRHSQLATNEQEKVHAHLRLLLFNSYHAVVMIVTVAPAAQSRRSSSKLDGGLGVEFGWLGDGCGEV